MASFHANRPTVDPLALDAEKKARRAEKDRLQRRRELRGDTSEELDAVDDFCGACGSSDCWKSRPACEASGRLTAMSLLSQQLLMKLQEAKDCHPLTTNVTEADIATFSEFHAALVIAHSHFEARADLHGVAVAPLRAAKRRQQERNLNRIHENLFDRMATSSVLDAANQAVLRDGCGLGMRGIKSKQWMEICSRQSLVRAHDARSRSTSSRSW